MAMEVVWDVVEVDVVVDEEQDVVEESHNNEEEEGVEWVNNKSWDQ